MVDLRGIWDEIKAQGKEPNPLSVLTTAKKTGVAVSLEDVRSISDHFSIYDGAICPNYVPKFIAAFLAGCSAETILDPWAGIGALLIAVTSNVTYKRAVGLVQGSESLAIARLMSGDADIEWKYRTFSTLDPFQDEFDAVVCTPPITEYDMRYLWMVAADGKKIEIRDHLGNLLMLLASQMLKPNGSALFVVPPEFFYRRTSHGVYVNLDRFNLFVDSALKLPKDVFAPDSTVGGYLIILKKHKQPSLFAAELTADERSNKVVLANLRARKEGQAVQLGVLVDATDFESFDALVRQIQIENIANEKGLLPFKLTDISTVNFVKLPESFADTENSVYLPLKGNKPAVTSIETLEVSHHSCAQLIADPAQVNAQYLANFFSGPIGRKVRDSLLASKIKTKKRSRLLSATVYLPKKEVQDEISLIDSSIENLSAELGILRRQLWDNPKNRKKIEEELKTISRNTRDDFETLIETLPSPLAQILWAYKVEDSPDRKVGYLLNFFEALIVFNSMVLLSVYEKDAFYAEQLKIWLKRFRSETLYKRFFGSWLLLFEILGGETRKLLYDDNNLDERLELFGNAGADDLFKVLVDERLSPIFAEAKEYRDLHAHDPVPSEAQSKKRLKVLQSCLTEFRGIAADQYENVLLFSPLDNKYASGIFHYRVQKLTGVRSPFANIAIDTLTQLENEKLHLAYASEKRAIKQPVELLPFIEFGPAPESQKNTFYFYDAIDPEVEYVSYDFDVEEKMPIPGNTQALIDAISKLKLKS